MPAVFDRIRRGLEIGLQAAQHVPDMGMLEHQLNELISNGDLPSSGEFDDWVEEKSVPTKSRSRLDIRKTKTDFAYSTYFRFVRAFARREDKVPEYGAIDRDDYLSKFWRTEPILAGAVYSMAAKMVSLKWTITGRKNLAKRAAEMLATAIYGNNKHGWGGFNACSAQDFYTLDRGVFWEVVRRGSSIYGRMQEIGYIDALQCELTGNAKRPVHYLSDMTGQSIRFRPGEYIHFASLTSGREMHMGIGFCAVSRAMRAAKLLVGLHDYDEEKLNNLPPEGVASVTGLTMDEFMDALALWRAARERDKSLTFPQVLWLIGSQPNAKVSVDIVGFSQLPESFDRKIVINQYVNTLALCFGVDAREFWPVSSGALGTAAETEVQHMKARGKGPGEYITTTEREINAELPEGVEFRYDTQDIEEDLQAATVAKAWVEAFLPLTEAGHIDKDMFMRLLADKGVVPDWMVTDDRVIATDLGVEEKQYNGDVVCIGWEGGILKQLPLPPVVLYGDASKLPDAVIKGGPGSGHMRHSGRPGHVGGSATGTRVGYFDVMPTYATPDVAVALRGELEVWGGERGRMALWALGDIESGKQGTIFRLSDGEVVGIAVHNVVEDGRTFFLDKLATKRPGYGRAAMLHMSALAIDSGVDRMLLFATNNSIGFYERLGMDRASGYVNGYEWSVDVMRSMLDRVVVKELVDSEPENGVFTTGIEFLIQEKQEEPRRNIRGRPIPEDEALQGSSVTARSINQEIALWHRHPVLSQYVEDTVD